MKPEQRPDSFGYAPAASGTLWFCQKPQEVRPVSEMDAPEGLFRKPMPRKTSTRNYGRWCARFLYKREKDVIIEVQGTPEAPVVRKIQVVKGESEQAGVMRVTLICRDDDGRGRWQRRSSLPVEGASKSVSDEVFMRKIWQALEMLEYKVDQSEVAKVEFYRPKAGEVLRLRHISIVSQPIFPIVELPSPRAEGVVKLPCTDCEVPDYDCADGAACAKGLREVIGKIELDYYPRGYTVPDRSLIKH